MKKLDADLSAVADVIRERSCTTKPLNFSESMADTVSGIPEKLDLLALQNLSEYRSKPLNVIDADTFNGNFGIERLFLPASSRVKIAAFQNSTNLTVADMGLIKAFENNTFRNTNLRILILRYSRVVTLSSTEAFLFSQLIGNKGLSGTVYYLSALVESYKTATDWSSLYAGELAVLPHWKGASTNDCY